MRVRIEKLRKRDLPGFYKLFKKALFEDFKEYSPEVAEYQWRRHRKNHLLKWVKTGDVTIFLAKNKEKKVVGILVSDRPVGGVVNCGWLIIARDFRGCGIGSRMLGFWEKWAKKVKCHLLTLTSDERNLRFYAKHGFKEYGFMEKGFFNDDDHLLYKRIGVWNKKSLELK